MSACFAKHCDATDRIYITWRRGPENMRPPIRDKSANTPITINASKYNLDSATHSTAPAGEMRWLIYDYVNTFLQYVMECVLLYQLEKSWRGDEVKCPTAADNLLQYLLGKVMTRNKTRN